MTLTHLSHFGLSQIGQTSDNILFEGSLAACKRMAFAHGMEIERYEGFLVGCDGSHATYTQADSRSFSRILLRNGGMIQKTRDGFCLVMPNSAWEND